MFAYIFELVTGNGMSKLDFNDSVFVIFTYHCQCLEDVAHTNGLFKANLWFYTSNNVQK